MELSREEVIAAWNRVAFGAMMSTGRTLEAFAREVVRMNAEREAAKGSATVQPETV